MFRYIFSSNPATCLFIFFLSNTIISYFSLPIWVNSGIILFGLIFPSLIAWRASPDPSPVETSLYQNQKEFLPAVPPWIWLPLGALVIFARFYKLTNLSAWPLYDEGMYGFYAAQLSRHWDWQMLYGPSQAPPLYLWLLAFTFKCFGVSLFSLWFLPALISSLLFPASYWAARGFFNRSFSMVIALLFGFGYWPLYVGRFSLMTGLVLLLECLTLGLLTRYLSEKEPARKISQAAALGAMVGVGFYSYLHWPFLAAVVGGTVVLGAGVGGKLNRFTKWKVLPAFLLSCAVFMFPLVGGISLEGLKQLMVYLHHLSAGSQTLRLSDQISISFSYIASLFWGMDLKYHTYQPVWGGYLNPLAGALCFMGGIEAARGFRSRLNQWLLTVFPFFILPGLLTSERATSRLILVFPVLAILMVKGLERLISMRPARNILILSSILFFSTGLDFYHLYVAYPAIWKSLDHWKSYDKSYPRAQAFLQLEKLNQTQGPGYLFADFLPGLSDQTLSVAVSRFNLSDHPEISPQLAPWAGLLTNANLLPFMKKRFPSGQAWWISKDVGSPDGGWMLWVIPWKEMPMETLRRWLKASASLKSFIERSLIFVPGQSMEPMENSLQKIYPLFQGDPLLETCYYEKMADLSTRRMMAGDNRAGTKQEAAEQALRYLKTALQRGYPSAHLYFKLGSIYSIQQKNQEARECFKKARGSLLDLTQASTYEKLLAPSGGRDGKP